MIVQLSFSLAMKLHEFSAPWRIQHSTVDHFFVCVLKFFAAPLESRGPFRTWLAGLDHPARGESANCCGPTPSYRRPARLIHVALQWGRKGSWELPSLESNFGRGFSLLSATEAASDGTQCLGGLRPWTRRLDNFVGWRFVGVLTGVSARACHAVCPSQSVTWTLGPITR